MQLSQKSSRKWCLRLAGSVAMALALVGLFNLLVDPFMIYRWVEIEGVNSNKYPATKHARMFKGYLLADLRPGAIALGSSRTEIGLDPGHRGWDPGGKPVFNMAVGGASISEVREILAAACREAPPRQVVLGLDLFMFNVFRQGGEEGLPLEDGLMTRFAKTLWSAAALEASVDTLLKQDTVRYPGYLPGGQINWNFNLAKTRRYGHWEAFSRNVRKYFADHYFPSPDHHFALADPVAGRSTLEPFEEILALARAHGIDLRLFISPVHAWQLLTIDQAGLWPLFEEWKRGLVAAVAAEHARYPGQSPLVLWDFSGFNSITTEAVPPPGDTQTLMTYYWEGSHYRKEAGDLVLDRIFSLPSDALPDDFGKRLSTDDLEAHLGALRYGLRDYRDRHPEVVSLIGEMAEAFPYLPQQPEPQDRK